MDVEIAEVVQTMHDAYKIEMLSMHKHGALNALRLVEDGLEVFQEGSNEVLFTLSDVHKIINAITVIVQESDEA